MSNQNNSIPEGFKMTEIGLLPEEWETTKLGDLFDIKQGKSLSPEHRRGISPRPFLRTANVFWGYLDLTTVDSMDFTDAEISQLKLMSNDLLVCEGGDIGRTAIWWDESKVCCYQNHLHRLRTARGDVHPPFYMYWMQAAHLLLRLYGGTGNKTTIPNLSQSRLKSFVLPLPPLPEQKAIANVLSTVQKAIEAQDKIIAAARELKKSLMRHLFTYGPVSVAEAEKVPLKETEIGPVPEHWDVLKLGEIIRKGGGSIQTGPFGSLLHASDYVRDGIPFVMPKDLDKQGRITTESIARIGLNDVRRLKRYRLIREDLLVGRRGEIGRRGMVTSEEEGWICGSGCLRLRLGNLLYCSFLSEIFETAWLRDWLTTNAIGTTMPNLSSQILYNLPAPLPPYIEQQEIACMLLAADKRIDAEENRKTALQAVFKTMLHHLMTGKVRVKDMTSGGDK